MIELFNNSYREAKQISGVMFATKDKEKVLYHNLVTSANDEMGISLARIAAALEKLAGINFEAEKSTSNSNGGASGVSQ